MTRLGYLGFQRVTTARLLRKVCLLALTVPFLTSAAIGLATASERENEKENSNRSYAIGLWGDLPYSDTQAQTGVPNLIADMNAQSLSFTVHNGDLKAGNATAGSVTPTTCSDDLYTQSLGYFNALKAPAIFTPGDNDWTDCDRPANGGFNSLERLNYERQIFFSTPYSLGKRRLKQEVQAAPYVENRRWTIGRVTYATLNVQGSCNNLCDIAPDQEEYAARNAANIAWLQETFKVAKARNSVAVMLIAQANPGWDNSDPTRAPTRDPRTLVENGKDANGVPFPDGFKDYLVALREEVIAFRKPVAYVHGDSHYYRLDKPLQDAQGRRLENFTRVETFGNSAANGNNDVQWLKVTVNPRSREVFSYQPQIVPSNRVAVPAP
ncbi:MAG: hypothetical protein KME42_18525 [Tildeniella nuda ZEHNDER 1965/U140]|nr:hypothetical protein [Tildeniella nuda ZEHNDER 1965/U140]